VPSGAAEILRAGVEVPLRRLLDDNDRLSAEDRHLLEVVLRHVVMAKAHIDPAPPHPYR
jgi:hypothetical protein